MSVRREIVQLMSAVDQPRMSFGAVKSDIAESTLRQRIFRRFFPISEKIFSQTGKITPGGPWGFSPHHALERAGGPHNVSKTARETQTLIPEARTALEQDVSEINFEELDKKDSKFRIVEKIYRVLQIASYATMGIGTAFAIMSDTDKSLIGIKTALVGILGVFVFGGIKEVLQDYFKPDVWKINYIIDRAKDSLNELERSVKELSEITGFFK